MECGSISHLIHRFMKGLNNSSRKRLALLRAQNLPEHMSANAMLQALNLLYTKQELEEMVK